MDIFQPFQPHYWELRVPGWAGVDLGTAPLTWSAPQLRHNAPWPIGRTLGNFFYLAPVVRKGERCFQRRADLEKSGLKPCLNLYGYTHWIDSARTDSLVHWSQERSDFHPPCIIILEFVLGFAPLRVGYLNVTQHNQISYYFLKSYLRCSKRCYLNHLSSARQLFKQFLAHIIFFRTRPLISQNLFIFVETK